VLVARDDLNFQAGAGLRDSHILRLAVLLERRVQGEVERFELADERFAQRPTREGREAGFAGGVRGVLPGAGPGAAARPERRLRAIRRAD